MLEVFLLGAFVVDDEADILGLNLGCDEEGIDIVCDAAGCFVVASYHDVDIRVRRG